MRRAIAGLRTVDSIRASFLVAALLCGEALAIPIHGTFSGAIVFSPSPITFALGTTVTGTFDYDSNATGTVIIPGGSENYPGLSFSISIGSSTYVAGTTTVNISNGPGSPQDVFNVQGAGVSGPSFGAFVPVSMLLRLAGPNTIWADTDLPSLPFDVTPFNVKNGNVTFAQPGFPGSLTTAQFDVTAITVENAAPEPGSLALLGAALGAFGLARRRKQT